MKSLVLVVVTAAISSSISSALLWQSSRDLRAESLTLAAEGGMEVRISATKEGLEIRSPKSKARVQLIYAGEENLSLRMTAQDTLFDVSVGGVPIVTLNNGDKGGTASMWAGSSGGAAAFQSLRDGYGVSINTQEVERATVTLRRLGKDKPQLQLELMKQPKVIQTRAD